MKRKWLAIALSMALAVGMLSGCGDNKETAANNDTQQTTDDTKEEEPAPADDTQEEEPAVELLEDGGGKVLNIYCWNEEFKERFEQYYPDYKDGKVGDVEIKFIQNVNEGSNYQDKLDEALGKQESAAADDKVDLFMAEADYIAKYSSAAADVAVDVHALGLTDDDMSNMYDYTKQVATDENGVLKGVSWQACPAGMIYRRSMAKKYFGTDDPDAIQEQVSDWDKFEQACKTIKEKSKGKDFMMAGPNDMHRIYTNNDSTKFVDGDKLTFTPGSEQWVDNTKKFCDEGYVLSPTMGLWSEDWNKNMGKDGHVFAFFGPAWFISFTMSAASGATQNDDGTYTHKDGKDSYGDWALCLGPQSFNWGGTWIMAAKGTDNAALIKDIMLKMTCDQTILYNISKDKQDYVNGKEACEKLSSDGVTAPFLGDQDMIGTLKQSAENISMTNLTIYDQACIENSENDFGDFFSGKSSKEDCLKKWQDDVLKKFPNLTV